MEKKKITAKKTKDKLIWLGKNYSKYKYRDDLRNRLSQRYGINIKHSEKIIKVFEGKKENTTDIREVPNQKSKIISKGKCYFCGKTKNIVEHHISYYPAIKVNLCRGCHNKIHILVDEYHDNEKKRLEKFKKIDKLITELKGVL